MRSIKDDMEMGLSNGSEIWRVKEREKERKKDNLNYCVRNKTMMNFMYDTHSDMRNKAMLFIYIRKKRKVK